MPVRNIVSSCRAFGSPALQTLEMKSGSTMIQDSIEVNGKTVTAEVEPRLTLLDFIRDVAGLKGTHAGCEHGVCGACTVLVDSCDRSCLVLAVQADEQEVISIEGRRRSQGVLATQHCARRLLRGARP